MIEDEIEIDLSPLSKWLNVWIRTERPLPRSAFKIGKLTFLCETLNILSFQGIAQETTCRECLTPHPAIVHYQCGSYFYKCLRNGEIELDQDHVRLFVLNKDALLDALADAADLTVRKRIEYVEGRLFRLGFVRDGGRIWPLAYADDLANPNVFAAVQEIVEKQFPDGPGLIATPSIINLNVPLYRSYRLVSLHELFFGKANQIILDRQMALIRLGRPKKIAGVPGRPTDREKTRLIRSELINHNRWPSARVAQVKLIKENWPDGGSEGPASKTIESQLRAFEDEN